MSISNQTNQVFGNGDGVTTTFSFPFKIFNTTDIQVYLINTNVTPNTNVLQTITTQYAVYINPIAEGGSVTFVTAPPIGYTWLVTRQEPFIQTVVIPTEGALPAQQISNQLDLMTMLCIQINQLVAQCIQVQTPFPSSSPLTLTPVPGEILGWNSAGNAIINIPVTNGGQVVPSGILKGVNGNLTAATAGTDYEGPFWVNVKDYGATGNGTTDDTSALQSALNTGLHVYMPNGTYKTTSTLTLKNNTVLSGAGQNNSIITYTGTGDALACKNTKNATTFVYITLRDFQINCTNGSPSALSACIDFVAGTYIYIERVYLQGNNYGIILDQSEIVTLYGVVFNSQLTASLWLVNGADHTSGASANYTNVIYVKSCQFEGYPTTAFVVDDGGNQHNFEDNNFSGGNVNFRLTAGIVNNTIRNCAFEQGLQNYIEFYTTTSVLGTSLSIGAPGNNLLLEGNTFGSPASSKVTVNIRANTLTSLVSIGNFFGQSANYIYTGTTNITSFSTNGDLVTSGGTLADNFIYVNYTGACTLVGWAASPTAQINIEHIGKRLYVDFIITGTSNSTSTHITIGYPSAVWDAVTTTYFVYQATDNGETPAAAIGTFGTTGVLTFYKDMAGSAWTSSGTKTVQGSFSVATTT